jgi:hypothetical protein
MWRETPCCGQVVPQAGHPTAGEYLGQAPPRVGLKDANGLPDGANGSLAGPPDHGRAGASASIGKRIAHGAIIDRRQPLGKYAQRTQAKGRAGEDESASIRAAVDRVDRDGGADVNNNDARSPATYRAHRRAHPIDAELGWPLHIQPKGEAKTVVNEEWTVPRRAFEAACECPIG